MSISKINITVFPTPLYSQGGTEILRDLLVWKYLQLNNSTFNSNISTRNCWTIFPSSEDLEVKEEKDRPSDELQKFFIVTAQINCIY